MSLKFLDFLKTKLSYDEYLSTTELTLYLFLKCVNLDLTLMTKYIALAIFLNIILMFTSDESSAKGSIIRLAVPPSLAIKFNTSLNFSIYRIFYYTIFEYFT